MKKLHIHKRTLVIIVSAIIFIVISVRFYRCSRPKLTLKSNEIKTYIFSNDTDTLLPDRHCGWINLDKFIELAKEKSNTVKTTYSQDSITISIDIDNLFGLDNGNWRNKYKNLPVRFPDDNSFTAKIKGENDTAYIYIPYQILSKLAAVDEKQVNKVQQTSKPKADGKKMRKYHS